MVNQSPIDQAIDSQLTIMELFLQDMLSNVNTAQDDIRAGKRDAAIGALLNSGEQFNNLNTLYDAILVMHRNASIVDGPEL